MSDDKQGADDSANITGQEYDNWHYEQKYMREIEPIPTVKEALNLYLIAVIVLGLVSAASVAIIGLLAFTGKEIPTELGSLGLVAITAIAGMVYVKKTA